MELAGAGRAAADRESVAAAGTGGGGGFGGGFARLAGDGWLRRHVYTMKPEKRHLMLDLMDEEQAARRAATFLAGGRILRRRRWCRVALRSVAVAAVLGAVVFSVQKPTPPRVRVIASVP